MIRFCSYSSSSFSIFDVFNKEKRCPFFNRNIRADACESSHNESFVYIDIRIYIYMLCLKRISNENTIFFSIDYF